MASGMVQSSLFEEGTSFVSTPVTRGQVANRIILLREELRVGRWDYERLLPSLARYQETVKRWRGITSFKYPQNKFDALEARAVVRFLKDWKSREANLIDEINLWEVELSKYE